MYGDFYPVTPTIDRKVINEVLMNYSNQWKSYNPSKPEYKRWGLSLTSLDGEMNGHPDLDSLHEVNLNSEIQYNEMSFKKQTLLFKECKEAFVGMNELFSHLGRSHFLKFEKGGFFPPHRDGRTITMNAFRLFCLVSPLESNLFQFTLNGSLVQFYPGRLYFINTLLEHSLVNFSSSALCLILNVELNDNTAHWIEKNLFII